VAVPCRFPPGNRLVEIDGARYCSRDTFALGVGSWGVAATFGVTTWGTAPPDLAGYTASSSLTQSMFSTGNTYDVMAAIDTGSGERVYVMLRATGSQLRNSTSRQAIVADLRAAASMIAAQYGRVTFTTTTFYRRTV
jgi:hypothetical protein